LRNEETFTASPCLILLHLPFASRLVNNGTTCPEDDVSLDSQQIFRGVWGFLTLEHWHGFTTSL
jgi:hypothetical protein